MAEPPKSGDDDGEPEDNHRNPSKPNDLDAPLPRPARRRRRAKADRGLPPDDDLANLARAYLERQRKHWPKIGEAGLLPQSDNKSIRLMVDDFKHRHRSGEVDLAQVLTFRGHCEKFGGAYERYSCDNSNPTSVQDQLMSILDKANAEGHFVPWQYVFADYSISGLDASRQGYVSYKGVLANEKHPIQVTFIDDFTRASRDELEWWKLAALSKRLKKGMIGAADGFDLRNPNSDILITVFGLVSRLFIRSLKEKVMRGMKGAARRGTCLGKLSLGFTRRIHRDANGNVVYRPDGRPRHEPCIDPNTRQYRRLMYELFVEQNWSAYRIARHFCKLKVDGWEGWTDSAIKKLLWNENAIGAFNWNKTHREYDWEEEKWVVVKNPPSEWERYYDPELAIVPKPLWRAARLKLWKMRKASPRTGKKVSRNENSATTLFSGTLFCKYCGEELKLIRSADKYKQMGCPKGCFGVHGCQLSSSKSVRMIEECLLPFLHEVVLSQGSVESMVKKANAIVEREARRPEVDTAPMKTKARKLEAAIDKLMKRVEDTDDNELCAVYDERIAKQRKDLNQLNSQIREEEKKNAVRPQTLPLEKAMAYLADFRKTMNAEIPVAADGIRKLTGPIEVRQEVVPGRPGARWIATFSPDFIRVLRGAASEVNGMILAFEGNMTSPAMEVVIDRVPKYEQLAPKFKLMRDNGASIQSIAHAHGMSFDYAKQILEFADTGRRPKWSSGKGGGKGKAKPRVFKDIAPEVVHLRNVKKWPFERIATKLGVSVSTVCRAYDFGCPDAVQDAINEGKKPRRGSSPRLGEEKHALIRKLLREGKNGTEIAAEVGCGTSTVGRVRQAMMSDPDDDKSA
jgi:DNA invertase Pin-like site-specific DNA recombinase